MFSPDVVNAIPFFSHGEGHIDEKITSIRFDQEGMKRMWDWYHRLSKNVMDFLAQIGLGERDSSIICDLHMSSILEKITRIQNEHDYYCSMVARYTC